MLVHAVPRRLSRIGLVTLVLAPLVAASVSACTTPLPPQGDPAAPTVTMTVLRTPDGRTSVPVPVRDGTETRYYPPSPRAINNEGEIVGRSPTEISAFVVEPVLWQDDDQAMRLSSNDRGQVLVGPADVPEGQPLRMATLWQDGEAVELPSPYRRPIDLNERGEVLAVSTTGVIGDTAVWADGRVTARLQPPRRADRFHATDLSDTGTVVGGVGYDVGIPFWPVIEWHPFVWRDGTLTELDMEGTAVAVNGTGQVLVATDRQPDGSARDVLWEDGVTTELELDVSIAGGLEERIINDQGQVVGVKDGRAHLWDDGQLTDLGTPEGTTSNAVAINEHGQIVGTMDMADGTTHGFVWTDGHLLDLGPVYYNPSYDPPDMSDAQLDINDQGQIIGRIGDPWIVDDATAVLWEVQD
jgi:probable HAF family extracellular repeat protein